MATSSRRAPSLRGAASLRSPHPAPARPHPPATVRSLLQSTFFFRKKGNIAVLFGGSHTQECPCLGFGRRARRPQPPDPSPPRRGSVRLLAPSLRSRPPSAVAGPWRLESQQRPAPCLAGSLAGGAAGRTSAMAGPMAGVAGGAPPMAAGAAAMADSAATLQNSPKKIWRGVDDSRPRQDRW